jgi:hypothetical protein
MTTPNDDDKSRERLDAANARQEAKKGGAEVPSLEEIRRAVEVRGAPLPGDSPAPLSLADQLTKLDAAIRGKFAALQQAQRGNDQAATRGLQQGLRSALKLRDTIDAETVKAAEKKKSADEIE